VGPNEARHWYDFFLPLAERGGPLLTLLLAILFVGSLWYGMQVVRECVRHNRQLNERILTQQQAFYQELRLALSQCPREP